MVTIWARNTLRQKTTRIGQPYCTGISSIIAAAIRRIDARRTTQYDMGVTFADQGTEDLFEGKNTPKARKIIPSTLHKIARAKLDRLAHVRTLDDLRNPPSNKFEALIGDRVGQYSIRINGQYRICFSWNGEVAADVEIVDCH